MPGTFIQSTKDRRHGGQWRCPLRSVGVEDGSQVVNQGCPPKLWQPESPDWNGQGRTGKCGSELACGTQEKGHSSWPRDEQMETGGHLHGQLSIKSSSTSSEVPGFVRGQSVSHVSRMSA